MAYNLPKPWDPGYCLPGNVDEEGLERRAFVTKQVPRGTYDDPDVGTGGYVVPQYVMDEGYGQGTYTTKWAPGGTYAGPRIPHWLNQHPQVVRSARMPGGGREITMLSAFGDAELPAPYEDYGQRAAQIILSRVKSVPPKKRQDALKQIMDKIDRSLWTRTQDIWKRYIAQGMNPGQAMPLAISRAMSTGLAAEVINTGLRRAAPQAKSLLGLGCYGCMAVLGDTADCQSSPGFSWVYGSAGIPGHWTRTMAGAQDVPFCASGAPPGAATVDPSQTEVRDNRPTGAFYVGPFQFDDRLQNRVWAFGGSTSSAGPGRTPDLMYPSPDPNWRPTTTSANVVMRPVDADVLGWLHDRLVEAHDAAGKTDVGTTYPHMIAQEGKGSSPDWGNWFDAMGITMDTPVRQHTLWYLLTGIDPLVRTKHPTTNEDLVMHVMLDPIDPYQVGSATNPLALKVWLSRIPDPGVLGSIWNTLVQIPATVVMPVRNAVVDTVRDLADLACDVLNSTLSGQQGQAASAAAATAAGAPPQVGAAGAALAQQACGQRPPAPVPPPSSSSLTTTLLIAGGAVAAVAILLSSRKRSEP
jgi:hypothetical protein